MNSILFFTTVFFTQLQLGAQILVFASDKKQVEPMTIEQMTFIAETLHAGKTALNLDCEVRVREIKQERKFSDGIRIVEMIEIIFRGGVFNAREQKVYFPVGSVLTKAEKVSSFSGTVEEMQLEAADLANSRFIFQHNGRGEIVWMSLEDDLKTLPCRLKN